MNNIELFNEIISVLLESIRLDNEKNFKSAARTAYISYIMADYMKLESKETLFYLSLIHDIGNLGNVEYPMKLQYNYGNLNVEKASLHIYRGANLIEMIPGFEDAKAIIMQHHELFNGSGYPNGLKGDEICLEAQILGLANYTNYLLTYVCDDFEKVMEQIHDQKDVMFSGYLINEFFEVFGKDKDRFETLRDFITIFETLENIIFFIIKNLKNEEVKVFGNEDLKNMLSIIIQEIINLKHPKYVEHSRKVAYYCSKFANSFDLSEQEREILDFSAILHDIGIIAVPNVVVSKLLKGIDMSDAEKALYDAHIEHTKNIVNQLSFIQECLPIISNHHEYCDGSGHPNGITSEKIPYLSKILTICDDFDLISSTIENRDKNHEEIFEIIKTRFVKYDSEIMKKATEIFGEFFI